MSKSIGVVRVAVVAFLLLVVFPPTISAEEPPSARGDRSEYRTWSSRVGTYRTEVALVDVTDSTVTLQTRDGKVIEVLLDSLSKSDQQYVKREVARRARTNETGKATDPSSVEINPTAVAAGKQMSVVATGVGVDPDKAKYNALSNAIEQVVGVLVDAETLVENDKLIRDRVLTYTEGDIVGMKILDQWQKDGLHYVRLRATVAAQQIESRLQQQHVAVREIDGEVFYDNAIRRQKNAENFTEMVAGALRDFGAEKMVTPVIAGKPEVVGQNAQFATMLVKVETKPDIEQWKTFRTNLLRVLTSKHRSTQRTIVILDEGTSNSDTGFCDISLDSDVKERMEYLDGNMHGHWVVLLQGYREGKEARSLFSQWTAHQVDKSIGQVFAELRKHKYRLHVRLIGKSDNIIAEDEQDVKVRGDYCRAVTQIEDSEFDAYFVAPFLWHDESYGHPYCPAMPAREFRISVPMSDLSDVARVTATIEQIKEQPK